MKINIGDKIQFEVKRTGNKGYGSDVLTGIVQSTKEQFGDTFIHVGNIEPVDGFVIRQKFANVKKI